MTSEKENSIQLLINTSFIWIQSELSRNEAVEILQKLKSGNFIIRINFIKHLLIISFKTKSDVQHVIINVVKDLGFYMDGSENIFQNIAEMISHYLRHPIRCPNLKLKLPKALMEACEPIHFTCLENLNTNFWTKRLYKKNINEILKENIGVNTYTSMSTIESNASEIVEENYSISPLNLVLSSPNVFAIRPSNDNIFSVFWKEESDLKYCGNYCVKSNRFHSFKRSAGFPMTNLERLDKTTCIWIQPDITRVETDTILDRYDSGIFIVRMRDNSKNITLSYKSEYKVKHISINLDLRNGFVIDGSKYIFHSINVMISHFMTHPIENTGLFLKLPRPLREAKLPHHFTFLSSLKSDFWNSNFGFESIYQVCNENVEPDVINNEVNITSSIDLLSPENPDSFSLQPYSPDNTVDDEADIYISFQQ